MDRLFCPEDYNWISKNFDLGKEESLLLFHHLKFEQSLKDFQPKKVISSGSVENKNDNLKEEEFEENETEESEADKKIKTEYLIAEIKKDFARIAKRYNNISKKDRENGNNNNEIDIDEEEDDKDAAALEDDEDINEDDYTPVEQPDWDFETLKFSLSEGNSEDKDLEEFFKWKNIQKRLQRQKEEMKKILRLNFQKRVKLWKRKGQAKTNGLLSIICTTKKKAESSESESEWEDVEKDDKNLSHEKPSTSNQTNSTGNSNEKETKDIVQKNFQEKEDEAANLDFKDFLQWSYEEKMKNLKNWNSECESVLREKFKEDYDKIYKRINIKNFTSRNELTNEKPIMKGGFMPTIGGPITGAAKNLSSLEMLKLMNGGKGNHFWSSINVNEQIEMDLQSLKVEDFDETTDGNPESILSFTLYKQSPPDDSLAEELNRVCEPIEAFSVDMLLSHTVEDLIEMMTCENDYIYTKDVDSPNDFDPKEHEKYLAKNAIKGKIVLIGNAIYYNKECTASCKIYEEIISWSNGLSQKDKVGPFLEGDIKSPLRNLVCRFGYPYVFIHLGACEHLITFTQCRLKPNGVNKALYPRRTKIGKYKTRFCNVENQCYAKWVVYDYERLPASPTDLCTNCLMEYCYFKGKKIGEFKLYPIEHFITKIYKN